MREGFRRNEVDDNGTSFRSDPPVTPKPAMRLAKPITKRALMNDLAIEDLT